MQSEAPVPAERARPRGSRSPASSPWSSRSASSSPARISRAHDTSDAQHWSDARAIPTVHLVAGQAVGGADALTLPGTLQAWNAAKLYARVGGYLKAWYKDIGAQVAAGTALGQIDTPELDQQIVQARADLASARANAASVARAPPRAGTTCCRPIRSRSRRRTRRTATSRARTPPCRRAQANLDRLLALEGLRHACARRSPAS